jgi:hypothetical protein
MPSQSCRSPNWDNFETPPWESRDKKPFGCKCRGETREYYMGEGGGFPRVQAVVSLVNLGSPVTCPRTKGASKSELNLLVGLMQVRVNN